MPLNLSPLLLQMPRCRIHLITQCSHRLGLQVVVVPIISIPAFQRLPWRHHHILPQHLHVLLILRQRLLGPRIQVTVEVATIPAMVEEVATIQEVQITEVVATIPLLLPPLVVAIRSLLRPQVEALEASLTVSRTLLREQEHEEGQRPLEAMAVVVVVPLITDMEEERAQGVVRMEGGLREVQGEVVLTSMTSLRHVEDRLPVDPAVALILLIFWAIVGDRQVAVGV